MLSIGKSYRARKDEDMIRSNTAANPNYCKVSADINNDGMRTQIQIFFESRPGSNTVKASTQKHIRLNGVPKKSSDIVGLFNAVLFTASDLDLIYGSPSLRRRYIDILLSQVSKEYLDALRRYQKSLRQRNHLLRKIRGGTSNKNELSYWDSQLAENGSIILSIRLKAVQELSCHANNLHHDLSKSKEGMACAYNSTLPIESNYSTPELSKKLAYTLETSREKDLLAGATTAGPHRDDLQIFVNNKDSARFSSRGQSRTAVLALKLSEAQFLAKNRGYEPVLLLDDILSELDSTRRDQVLNHISSYEQCIITTAEPSSISNTLIKSTTTQFTIDQGSIFTVPEILS